MPTRFFWRIYASYILLILLTTATSVVFVSRQVRRDSRAEIERTLQLELHLLRELALPALAGQPSPDFTVKIRDLGERTETRFTVIALDGRVLADSEENPTLMDSHATRPEVLEALAEGDGQATRYSRTLRVEMLYMAMAVWDENATLGTVRAALPLSRVDRLLGETRNMIFLGAALATLAALLLGLILARGSTRPLESMAAAARAIAAGDHRRRAPESSGSKEIHRLALAFNSMADQLEQRLVQGETERGKLSAILAGMSEGVLAVDGEERILHTNALAADLLRIDPDADLGRPLWESTRNSAARELVAEALKEGRFLRREATLETNEGQRIIELKVSPLLQEGADPAGAVLVMTEVTEIRRLEAMRRDFIANASHELKTPLTAIQGLAETLNEDPGMDTDTRERFIGKLHRQTVRLSSLVSDLLSISRIESEDVHLDRAPLDLAEIVRDCFQGQSAAAEAKRLDYRMEVSEETVEVIGDRAALCQALGNLLDNAVKYTPEGGRVTLSIRREDGRAALEVTDSGIGIEPEHQARIFERFYRVDKARSRDLGGTGLGLSIVKNVALAHGGEVSVESEPGRGSTFRISLPLRPRS